MKNLKIFSIIAATLALPAFVACTDDDSAKVQNLAAKATITQGGYYSADAALTTMVALTAQKL